MIRIYVETVTRDSKYANLLRALQGLGNIELHDDPQHADAILVTDDDATLIRRSPVYRAHPAKCIAINDGDVLSYYIPTLYPCNFRSYLSRNWALTTSFYAYAAGDSALRNHWIDPYKDVALGRRLLYSFMGGSTCWLRKRLFRLYATHSWNDVLVQCTDGYRHWDVDGSAQRSGQQRRYVETMVASRFALCPRGASASSIRLFEAMELGCAPVILSDRWVPIAGIDWSFCIFVPESSLGRLDAIIRSHADEWQARGAIARRTYQTEFAPSGLGRLLERQIRDLFGMRSEGRERFVRAIYPAHVAVRRSRRVLKTALRSVVLSAFSILRLRFPYELNR